MVQIGAMNEVITWGTAGVQDQISPFSWKMRLFRHLRPRIIYKWVFFIAPFDCQALIICLYVSEDVEI